MTDPNLSVEGDVLADAALVHSVRLEVEAAAAGLQEWPLDTAAAARMRQALAERLQPAQQALSRLQSQSPLPGVVSAIPTRALRPLPSPVQDGAHTPPTDTALATGGHLGPDGAAS